MTQFHLAPWRPYKGIVLVAVLVIPIIYYLASTPFPSGFVSATGFIRRFIQMSLIWAAGWFLILFGDGSFGRVILSSMRSYYVMLGIGVIALPMIEAIFKA